MPVYQTLVITLIILIGFVFLLTAIIVYLYVRQKQLEDTLKAQKELLSKSLKAMEKLKEGLDLRDKVYDESKSELIGPILNTIYRFWPSDN